MVQQRGGHQPACSSRISEASLCWSPSRTWLSPCQTVRPRSSTNACSVSSSASVLFDEHDRQAAFSAQCADHVDTRCRVHALGRSATRKFSSTVRERKICRSCGTRPTPAPLVAARPVRCRRGTDATVHGGQPHHRGQKCRLADAVAAQQRPRLAGPNGRRRVPEDDGLAIARAQALSLEQRFSHGDACSTSCPR